MKSRTCICARPGEYCRSAGTVVLSFLDCRMEGHRSIFESNLEDPRIGSKPLNVFVSPAMLQAWARALDLEIETIRAGDEPYIRLSRPIRFETGALRWTMPSSGSRSA